MTSRGRRRGEEREGRGARRPPASNSDLPLTWGFSLPGLGAPGKVLAFKSRESGVPARGSPWGPR